MKWRWQCIGMDWEGKDNEGEGSRFKERAAWDDPPVNMTGRQGRVNLEVSVKVTYIPIIDRSISGVFTNCPMVAEVSGNLESRPKSHIGLASLAPFTNESSSAAAWLITTLRCHLTAFLLLLFLSGLPKTISIEHSRPAIAKSEARRRQIW